MCACACGHATNLLQMHCPYVVWTSATDSSMEGDDDEDDNNFGLVTYQKDTETPTTVKIPMKK